MTPEDQYHVGIVVEDLDDARIRLTDLAGYRWCDEFAGDQQVETTAGTVTVPVRFAYSRDEPRLELVQAVPGTVWEPADSGIHHLGYWSDDVDAGIADLAARGFEVEVSSSMGGDALVWAYAKAPAGPRIELVSRTIQPILVEWFRTGRLPGA